ncbi:MAG: protein-glutamate O-methyltransferase CheR [Planctomycetes bacterium]|nr:protein-glutamate O-methyltransferase CheR [Planctomycetota bacterium]
MPLTAQQFEGLRAFVLERSAIVLEPGKEYLVESRLAPLAREFGYASLGDLLLQLGPRANHELCRRVVEAMTTNETSFFRDAHPFEALRTHILPELVGRRRHRRRLDIWCAASSTGQEPYSLAITLLEHVPEAARWQLRIVATDLAEDILARAREGRYSQHDVNRGMPPALLGKYFQREGDGYRVRPEVKRLVEFRQMNLAQPWVGLPPMDLVFLRNVLIYFSVATKKRILENVRSVLAEDGYLCLGAAETTLGVCDAFQRCPIGKAVLYRPVAQPVA